MANKIIFKKVYPRVDDLLHEIGNCDSSLPEDEVIASSLLELLKKDCEEKVYVLIPQRVEQQELFIDASIALSEACQVDLLIMEHTDRISSTFTVAYAANLPRMKELVQLADDIMFTCGPGENEMQIILDYYTHAIYRNGEKIR